MKNDGHSWSEGLDYSFFFKKKLTALHFPKNTHGTSKTNVLRQMLFRTIDSDSGLKKNQRQNKALVDEISVPLFFTSLFK